MTLAKNILKLCIPLTLLASASMACAGEPVTDPQMAVAKQRIRCGATADVLAKLATAPGSQQTFNGLGLMLRGQALKAGATPEMVQEWRNEMQEQIAPLDEAKRKAFWKSEYDICQLYGLFELAASPK